MLQFLVIFAFGCLFVAVIALASKNGSKAAQLENLKIEIKRSEEERRRAEKIANSVDNMSSESVRERLQDVAGK